MPDTTSTITTLPTFTVQDMRCWGACCDPTRHLPEDWTGTALDMLRQEQVPPQDRLWAVLREEVIDARTLRLFAVWCVREQVFPAVRSLGLEPDPRSVEAVAVAERYAHGNATDEELRRASDAASDAAWAARAAWDAEAASRAASRAARDAQVAQLVHMLEAAVGASADQGS